jgi:hypothetical protein
MRLVIRALCFNCFVDRALLLLLEEANLFQCFGEGPTPYHYLTRLALLEVLQMDIEDG